jgi:hypothetical protein
MILEVAERRDGAFASAVTRMVGPMAQVRYICSWAEKDGSFSDSVAK